MNSRTFHKALFCIIVSLLITLPSMAQGKMSDVDGTYSGSMSTKIEKDGKITEGSVKYVSFVFSQSDNGQPQISLKNYSIAKYSFLDIILSNNTIQNKAEDWEITQNGSVKKGFITKDKRFDITLEVRNLRGTIAPNGTCHLTVEIEYEGSVLKHEFTGKRVTTGITNVHSTKKTSQVVYDLQGRRVEKPGRGIYIVNGKKVVM